MATYELNRYFEADETRAAYDKTDKKVDRFIKAKEYNGLDRRLADSKTAPRYNKKNEAILEGDAAFERRVLKAKFYDKAGVELSADYLNTPHNTNPNNATSKNPFVVTNAIGAPVSDSRDLRSVGAGSAYLSQEILNYLVDKNKPVSENEIRSHFKNMPNSEEVIQGALDCLISLNRVVKTP